MHLVREWLRLLMLNLRLRLSLLLGRLWRPELGLRRLLRLLLLQLWMLLLLNLRLGLLLLGRLRRPELRLRRLLLLLLARLDLLLHLLSRRDGWPVASHLLWVVIERCARGSGGHLGHNLPLHYRGWRFSRSDCRCAHDASLYRRHVKVALHFRRLNL